MKNFKFLLFLCLFSIQSVFAAGDITADIKEQMEINNTTISEIAELESKLVSANSARVTSMAIVISGSLLAVGGFKFGVFKPVQVTGNIGDGLSKGLNGVARVITGLGAVAGVGGAYLFVMSSSEIKELTDLLALKKDLLAKTQEILNDSI
jgi:hypothetical protein